MITEYVLLLGLFAFVVGGAFFGDSGPRATFDKSVPRLAARIEYNISTGRGFPVRAGGPLLWIKPAGGGPNEAL